MLIRHAISGFKNRILASPAGLLILPWDIFVPRHTNILAVLGTPGGKILIPASNIVTDAGDVNYAQRATAETVTDAFGILELGTAGTPGKAADRSDFTPIAATQKAHDASYPKTDDPDADNTGAAADVVTYVTSYAKADFNDPAINNGWITNVGPGATEPLLTGYAFPAPFGKTVDDTLKVFTNHQMNGV